MILPSTILNLINHIEECGFEAFAVGGAVRDFLLGKAPVDWDIATSALPNDIINIFGRENCIPTGIKHGTITVVADKKMIEVTTYRVDGEYLDNRHPQNVAFSKNICDDLSRRDYTINAMAYNTKIGLVDPFGGQADLNTKTIRTVGDPQKRFEEDGLRIIRGLRFAAVLDFKIGKQTKAAIHTCKNLLVNIARERLQAEFSKLVMSSNPENILTEFADVFAMVLGIDNDFCEDIWINNSKKLSACKELSVRLAVLLENTANNQVPCEVLRALKYDNSTIFRVKTIEKYIDFKITPDRVCIKKLLSEIGCDMLRLVLEAQKTKYPENASYIYHAEKNIDEILRLNECYCQKDLAINGNDLMELGIKGTEIGRILKLILNAVIEEKYENEKSALLKLAEKLI